MVFGYLVQIVKVQAGFYAGFRILRQDGSTVKWLKIAEIKRALRVPFFKRLECSGESIREAVLVVKRWGQPSIHTLSSYEKAPVRGFLA
jgi:hypothetical protein